MKRLYAFIRSRYPWAIGAGLLLAASFPNIGIAGLAWIAPALILLTAIGKPGKQAFRIGYVAGVAHYLASLYWLLLIPVKGFPILGWVALSLYLALYPATWVWLTWKIFPAKLNTDNSAPSFQQWAERFLSVPWSQRMLWAVSGAALWVALEMTISRLFSGFPWNLLGSSQYKIVPLIQISSITGIYGLSFLTVWTALTILCAAMVIVRRPAMRSAWIGEIILPMAVVVALYGSGYRQLLKPESEHPQLTVALIQPSIPQTEIWDPKETSSRFKELLHLSELALTNKPDVVIWPEAAVPKMVRYDDDTHEAITGFAHEHKVWMIIGSDDAEPHPHSTNPRENDYFNSSFLVGPDGTLVERYKKRNLVIFGEYIPLVKWLPFVKYLTTITGSFTPGDRVVPFVLPDLHVKVSVLICFEDVFPHLVPEYVSDDTDFLVNLTNNGWFGEGAAQWQHGAAAVFRAVENGIPLVRCSNNGLTCWVDAHGRIQQVFKTPDRDIYGPGFLIARIPLLQPGEKRAQTFYQQHGDLFGWACVGISLIQLVRVRLQQGKKVTTTNPHE
ncbi:MAG: Apolipoprotein N-acyltransferase [Pedosphaera sp.]|nr:Apolipoprotein N-acyltransferase [Pedosphaera sp.]